MSGSLNPTEKAPSTALIAFGSNLGDSQRLFDLAIQQIRELPGTTVVAVSQPVTTKPAVGLANDSPQDAYLNAVLRVETSLAPEKLLHGLAQIENQLGRQRSKRWGSRTVDLDLLLVGEQVINTVTLALPHPRMTFRRFVLEPAAEIAADVTHPIAGCTIQSLLDAINRTPQCIGLVATSLQAEKMVESLIDRQQKMGGSTQLEKVFSAEKFSETRSRLTLVAAFENPEHAESVSAIRQGLRKSALAFAGPTLLLPLDLEMAMTELKAAIESICEPES
jgi:2-amino-4-hydroxy-6-hydroxymethyldihydropteridine diphosphokinase